MTGKLRSIQILRAIAASAVVIGHAGHFALGSVGVDIFFVISGFIIATVMMNRSPVEFILDRVRRVYPIFYVHLLPWFLIAVTSTQLSWQRIVASLTLWPVYHEFERAYLKVAWTLSFEMLFYIAATICLITKRPLIIFTAYLLVMASFILHPTTLTGFLGNPIVLEFLMGIAITRISLRPKIGGALAVIGTAAILLSNASLYSEPVAAIDAHQSIWRVLAWGVPSGFLVYGVRSLEGQLQSRHLNWTVKLGDASYSIYLSHLLILLFLPETWWIAAPIAVWVGWLLYEAVERPLLTRLSPRKVQPTWQPQATAA